MAHNPFSDLTIVLVEDHDEVRRTLALFLSRMGASVLVARNAMEGLTAVTDNNPDLVISDVSMPGQDGIWLLARIRGLDPKAGGLVPVIAISALLGRADRKRLLSAGFQAYLPKPFGPAKLMKTISGVLKL
jgi:CheY-like chemotaxis protein